MTFTLLTQLQRKEAYRQSSPERERAFPSQNTLDWYLRQHRAELVNRGALVLHANRWHIVADRFDAYVIEAGQQAAQRHAGGAGAR